MSDCDSDKCPGLASLTVEVRWIKRVQYVGFAAVIGVTVYFNHSLQTAVIEDHDASADVRELLLASRNQHALEVAKIENKVNSFEILCCEELKSKRNGP